jgi:hypothetical protein
VPVVNAGLKVPLLGTRLVRVETAEGARVTVTVYVDVVVPFCAVTTVVSAFDPTTSGSEALAAPETTVTPFTFTVAVLSVTVGVSVTEAVALVTLEV